MNILRQTMKAILATTMPSRLMMVRGPVDKFGRNIDSQQRMPQQNTVSIRQIALTFDDGPHPEQTPQLLDQLADAEIQTTFFVVGREAKRYPEIIRRIVAEGHDLGNHTFTHGEPARTSAKVFLDEIRQTRKLLQDLTGHDCRLVRPPKGKLTFPKLLGLWKMDQTVVLWNVDPRDYAMKSDEEMRDWSSRYLPRDGDIVLMHDNHSFAHVAVGTFIERTFRPADRQCLPEKAIRCEEIRFVKILDWLTKTPAMSVEERYIEGANV